ncbi:hypothetical protein CO100_00355, partial [Candidatus Berkelbacteria bacterium CG_4_9_14_3_um_filter_33_5]
FAKNSNLIDNQLKNDITKIGELKSNYDNLTILSYSAGKLSEDLLQCHVTIKGIINGKKVDLDITFTSDSGSCIKDTVKLLKDLAAK